MRRKKNTPTGAGSRKEYLCVRRLCSSSFFSPSVQALRRAPLRLSATFDGNDVTDAGIDFTSGQKISNVQIELTQHAHHRRRCGRRAR